MQTLPESPGQLLEVLVTLFPEFRAFNPEPLEPSTTFHSVVMDFTPFFGKNSASFSEKQLRAFGNLVNIAVAADGSLENAFSTCFLEHLHQIKASRILRPYLSSTARQKTHA